ncbi:MAG: hypothetical protein K2W85_17505 [Phycisphaerales bacterium]|nr:hypothetical protein [Phycisphaerales bacterium]
MEQRGGLHALGRSRVRSDAAPAVILARRGDTGPIIIPLRPSEAAIARGSVTIELSDAESIVAPLRFIAQLPPANPRSASSALWFEPQPIYRVYRPGDRPRDAAGLWVAECLLGEREPAQVRADGRTLVVRWSPASDAPEVPGRDEPRSRLDEQFKEVGRSPLDRWRVRLALGTPIVDTPAQEDRIDDPTIDGLARQLELQWDAAIRRVDQADPAMGRRLRAALAGLVLIDGDPVHIWTESRERLETLRRELLAEGLTTQDAREIASGYLTTPGIEGAIVRDDAAAVNLKTGVAYPSVLMVNLTSAPAAAWVGRRQPARGAVTPSDMLRLEPLTGQTITFPGENRRTAEVVGDDEVIARDRLSGVDASRLKQPTDTQRPDVLRFECGVGDWIGERAAVGRIAPVRPPGISIGPLLSDWTQESFVRALAAPSTNSPMAAFDPALGVQGRLFRSGEAGSRWTLYLECVSSIEASADQSVIAVYLGPRTRATRIEVTLADGTMREYRAGKESSTGRALMSRSAGVVSIWMTIPADAIEISAGRTGPSRESEGLLRLGLTRSTNEPSFARGSWPRPMFPWDDEPSRVALDLSTWAPANE